MYRRTGSELTSASSRVAPEKRITQRRICFLKDQPDPTFLTPSPSKTQPIKAQAIATPHPPHHAQLVEALLAAGRPAADVPLLRHRRAVAARAARPFAEAAVRTAVGAATVPRRRRRARDGIAVCGVVVLGRRARAAGRAGGFGVGHGGGVGARGREGRA